MFWFRWVKCSPLKTVSLFLFLFTAPNPLSLTLAQNIYLINRLSSLLLQSFCCLTRLSDNIVPLRADKCSI